MPKSSDRFECTVSMVYIAEDPIDAAEQLLDNIAGVPTWFVNVKDLETGREFVVDTESREIECEKETKKYDPKSNRPYLQLPADSEES